METALSLQFNPLAAFGNAHLGLFWEQSGLRTSFPKLIDAAPIEPQFERFGLDQDFVPFGGMIKFGLAGSGSRLQMLSETGDRMIQVQNGRLVHNWRRVEGQEYPRFEATRPEFLKLLENFARFSEHEKLGQIEPNQWEVIYVNVIPRGPLWDSPGDWADVFPDLLGHANRVGPGQWESATSTWRFELPNRVGRLHVELNHGLTGNPQANEQAVILQLTARGPITQSNRESIESAVNLGHDAVVLTFDGLVGPKAKKLFGRSG